MYTRCKSCGADMPFKRDVVDCPRCGGLIGKILRTERGDNAVRDQARPAGGKKKALRAQRRRALTHFRGVLQRDTPGYRLETESWTRRVRVTSDLPVGELLGISLPWQGVRAFDGVLDIWPEACKEIDRIRARVRAAADRRTQDPDGVLDELDPRFGAQSPGTSPLETMMDPMKQLREIKRLAERKKDPVAWATLANGYRVRSIRLPIESAARSIGPEKFNGMFTVRPGDWPEEFVAFIGGEMERLRARRTQSGKKVPSQYEAEDL